MAVTTILAVNWRQLVSIRVGLGRGTGISMHPALKLVIVTNTSTPRPGLWINCFFSKKQYDKKKHNAIQKTDASSNHHRVHMSKRCTKHRTKQKNHLSYNQLRIKNVRILWDATPYIVCCLPACLSACPPFRLPHLPRRKLLQ